MKKEEFNTVLQRLKEKHGVTKKDFAKASGQNYRYVLNWTTKGRQIPSWVASWLKYYEFYLDNIGIPEKETD